MSNLFFVDCEGHGPAPGLNDSDKFEIGIVVKVDEEQAHRFTDQFGAVGVSAIGLDGAHAVTDVIEVAGVGKVATFYGIGGKQSVFEALQKWILMVTAGKGRAIFVSDNPAYDWQFPNFYFHKFIGSNPFGHSARRISDYYAGLRGDFTKTQEWKSWRRTNHDHHPVHDALGNLEAFYEIQKRAFESRNSEGEGEFAAFLREFTR